MKRGTEYINTPDGKYCVVFTEDTKRISDVIIKEDIKAEKTTILPGLSIVTINN